MSYYHSDEFEAWLVGDLGMSSTRLDGEVDVETRSNQCYACMDPSNQNAYFSDGSGYTLKNPTRERSIVAHEYMHAVSHQYNTLDQSFNAEALNEGYSDFFAVADRHANTSVTSKRLGAYVGLGSGRTVDNDYQLSEFENGKDLTGGGYSEHDGGVVLAGALWDFKQNIGSATLVAEITLESLNYLDSDPSFYDARSTMLTAADGTGNSQYECDIKRAFEEHGIGGSGLLVSNQQTLRAQ
jgi:Zn-dependent metalloprotease